eukprot:CAMPEP_0114981870 /NCGR_PEP_ID=MMETSP0216-20121206/5781_1 /TAXON_ID=223996 /ORGANISM="Protocruzia adherens, Strain Boccale" /LENGTH=264 /DNA_ID=CAMNT_0002343583 /DNA_START=1147 /DNA_END=1941 /DNA_ORIENTATION=+
MILCPLTTVVCLKNWRFFWQEKSLALVFREIVVEIIHFELIKIILLLLAFWKIPYFSVPYYELFSKYVTGHVAILDGKENQDPEQPFLPFDDEEDGGEESKQNETYQVEGDSQEKEKQDNSGDELKPTDLSIIWGGLNSPITLSEKFRQDQEILLSLHLLAREGLKDICCLYFPFALGYGTVCFAPFLHCRLKLMTFREQRRYMSGNVCIFFLQLTRLIGGLILVIFFWRIPGYFRDRKMIKPKDEYSQQSLLHISGSPYVSKY